MSLAPPRSLHFKIHLGSGVCGYPGEGPRIGQVWKKKPDNWAERRQRPGRTALSDCYKWLDRLFPAHPLTGGECPHSFCLASILTKHFSVCSPTCCYVMSLIINFISAFTKIKKRSWVEYKPCVFQGPDMMTIVARRWRRPVWREIRDEMEVRL